MHNESIAEQVSDNAAANGNGVFESGESGLKVTKNVDGFKFGVRFTNKQLIVGAAALTAGVLLKRYGVRSPVVNSAQKIQDVAEQAEEAAARR